MDQQYIGSIFAWTANYAPVAAGWPFCQGQTMAIAQNDTLFALIGTTFGGDGVQTFNLPDLRGRVPIGQGQGQGLPSYTLGQNAGQEAHTLTELEMPIHSHALMSSTNTSTIATPGSTVHLGTAST